MCLALLLGGCSSPEDVRVLKLAHELEATHVVNQAMIRMAGRLEELSGGSMRIDIYPGGQLGSERELIELLQIGSLAMTKVSTSPMEGFVPELRIFNTPYIFRDKDHYQRVLDGEIGRELLAAGRHVRLRGLGYYDSGSRSFYSTERPIRSPADLEGMKIRVQNSQSAIRMIQAMGGAATPISYGELYTSLQQGVVDGAENNPPSFYTARHFEVSGYFSLDEHTYVPDMLIISEYVWNTLSDRQQQWVTQAADESIVYQRELWKQATDEAMAAVEAAGVEIIYPDKTPFRQAVLSIQEDVRQSDLGELLRRIEDTE